MRIVQVTDIEFVNERETELAWLVRTSKGREVWIAKSQAERNDDGSLEMEEWKALDKGLI